MRHSKVNIFLLVWVFFIFGCARPKYDEAHANKIQNELGQGSMCPNSFAQENLCFNLTWQSESQFTLSFWEKNSGSSQGPMADPRQSVSVTLWMPQMGHGSSPVEIKKLGTGIFEVSHAYFIMPGDWEIQVKLSNGDIVTDQVNILVHIKL